MSICQDRCRQVNLHWFRSQLRKLCHLEHRVSAGLEKSKDNKMCFLNYKQQILHFIFMSPKYFFFSTVNVVSNKNVCVWFYCYYIYLKKCNCGRTSPVLLVLCVAVAVMMLDVWAAAEVWTCDPSRRKKGRRSESEIQTKEKSWIQTAPPCRAAPCSGSVSTKPTSWSGSRASGSGLWSGVWTGPFCCLSGECTCERFQPPHLCCVLGERLLRPNAALQSR